MLGTADVALPLLPLALAIVKLLGWGWWRCCSSSEGVALVQRSHTDHRSLYFVSTIGFVSTSLRLWGWSAWMPYASLWLVREVGLAVGWVLVTYNVGKLLAPVWGYFSGYRPGLTYAVTTAADSFCILGMTFMPRSLVAQVFFFFGAGLF